MGLMVLRWFSSLFAHKKHLQSFEKSYCLGHILDCLRIAGAVASESPTSSPDKSIVQPRLSPAAAVRHSNCQVTDSIEEAINDHLETSAHQLWRMAPSPMSGFNCPLKRLWVCEGIWVWPNSGICRVSVNFFLVPKIHSAATH